MSEPPYKEPMYVGTQMSDIWQRWFRGLRVLLGNLTTRTGWTAPTGTASRATYVTYAGQTISNPPTQAQVQAIDDHLKILSRHQKALIDDLAAQKLIGP